MEKLGGDNLSQNQVLLKKLRDIVLDNLDNEDFSVQILASTYGISRSQLHRKLKRLNGLSVSQFIREIRLDEAMRMLRNNEASVSEIAYSVGFNTPSYFHKCFHDHYGYSPGEVRNIGNAVEKKNEAFLWAWKNRMIPLFSQWRIMLPIAAVLVMVLLASKYSNSSSPTTNEINSIAILPLKPLSKDTDQSYLALGMHDAIIGELGKVSGLRVISKTSTLPYMEDTDKLLPEIAKELGVQAIVEGSVFISGDSIRLQIQLIEVFPKERHLWAQEYYEQIGKVLNVQSQLVQDIASEVRIKLTPNENRMLTKNRVIDPETYRHYLRGMYYLNTDAHERFAEGMIHLKKAIESDPADPFAYSGLALGYAILGHGQNSKQHVMPKAKAAAEQALLLDENMDNAHAALGMVNLYYQWDWEKSKQEFDLALQINPNNEFAHANLAWLYVLLNENELAIEHATLATEINPLFPTYQLWLGWMHQLNGNYEKAIQETNKLLEFEPNFTFAHYVLGSVYYDQGNYSEALREYEKIGWENDLILSAIGSTYAKLGHEKKALEIVDKMDSISKVEFVNPVSKAFLEMALNRKDLAMAYLNKAHEHKFYPLPWIKCVNDFDSMKKDSTFLELLQKMNLGI